MNLRSPLILAPWALVTAALSLGCLIPAPDDGQDGRDGEDDNNWWMPDPNSDNNTTNPDPGRPTNPERDDPSSPNYRGNFEAIMSGDQSLTLDADGLGEATASNVPAMAGFNEAHCLISLIDREPDTSGHTGYLLFHYPGRRCPLPGSYVIESGDASDGVTHEPNVILFKSLQLEQESADGATYSSYLSASGVLTITANSDGVLKGELNMKLGMRSVDDAQPVGASVEVKAAFDAPYLEL